MNEPVFVPALSVPFKTKLNYECPSEHIDCLLEFMPKVTKLLVIGWRAAEANFCQLLGLHLQKNLKVLNVSSSVKGANEINGSLQEKGLSGEFFVTKGGFTDFVVNRRSEEFFST